MRKQEKGSLDPAELLHEIESLKIENSRLKQTVTDQTLDISTLKQWRSFVKKKLRKEKLDSQRNSSVKRPSKSSKKRPDKSFKT